MNPYGEDLSISKIMLEEVNIDSSMGFQGPLKKINRENLGRYVIDEKDTKIMLNKPDPLLLIEPRKPAPFKFTFSSSKYKFSEIDNKKIKTDEILGKLFLIVTYYDPILGKIDKTTLRVPVLYRIIN